MCWYICVREGHLPGFSGWLSGSPGAMQTASLLLHHHGDLLPHLSLLPASCLRLPALCLRPCQQLTAFQGRGADI